MEIIFLESVNSTHEHVLEELKEGRLAPPFALFSKVQTKGIGSRGNSWLGGEDNLYVTFALCENDLPKDLSLISISIYFSMILKEQLKAKGSKIWVKWPNDLFLDGLKIGGVMSVKKADAIIVSIGLNCSSKVANYGALDIKISPSDIVKELVACLKNPPTWKKIFSIFRLEFLLSKKMTTNIDGELVSLEFAQLCEDGSIQIENKKVYSLR